MVSCLNAFWVQDSLRQIFIICKSPSLCKQECPHCQASVKWVFAFMVMNYLSQLQAAVYGSEICVGAPVCSSHIFADSNINLLPTGAAWDLFISRSRILSFFVEALLGFIMWFGVLITAGLQLTRHCTSLKSHLNPKAGMWRSHVSEWSPLMSLAISLAERVIKIDRKSVV